MEKKATTTCLSWLGKVKDNYSSFNNLGNNNIHYLSLCAGASTVRDTVVPSPCGTTFLKQKALGKSSFKSPYYKACFINVYLKFQG